MTDAPSAAVSLERAMSLWQALIEMQARNTAVAAAFERMKPAEVRCHMAALCPSLDDAYHYAARRGYDAPFDWDFCPAFLVYCVDWSDIPSLRPDWQARVDEHVMHHAY